MRWLIVVPNALSFLRLLVAGAFPFAPSEWRLALVLTAGATDFADGFIARRFKLTSWAGGLLDAVADKAFALSVLLTYTLGSEMQAWQMAVLMSRDGAVLFIALYAAAMRKWYAFRHMPSRLIGKLTTAMMFAFFVIRAWPEFPDPWPWVAFVITASLSLLAAADYLVQFFTARKMDKLQSQPPQDSP